VQDSDPDADDVKRTAHREAALMAQLKSEHVVQCLDSFLVRDRLCIVMEFLPLTLLDFLESRNGGRGLTSEVIRHIMYQVCKVMTFIHDQVRRLLLLSRRQL
jgi:serine/threonine protein kinase